MHDVHLFHLRPVGFASEFGCGRPLIAGINLMSIIGSRMKSAIAFNELNGPEQKLCHRNFSQKFHVIVLEYFSILRYLAAIPCETTCFNTRRDHGAQTCSRIGACYSSSPLIFLLVYLKCNSLDILYVL